MARPWSARERWWFRTRVLRRDAKPPRATRSAVRRIVTTGPISVLLALAVMHIPASATAGQGGATPTPDGTAVSAADCRAEPRPVADFAAIAAATPLSYPEVLRRAEAMNQIGTPPAGGVPADPAVVAGVTDAVKQIFACLLTEDFARYASLLTDDNFRRNFAGLDPRAVQATPNPSSMRVPLPLYQIEEVRVLPDGRVTAEIDAERGRSISVFVESDGRYLLDGGFELVDGGVPTPTP